MSIAPAERISLLDVSKDYHVGGGSCTMTVTALHRVTLSAHGGEVVAVFGGASAGKTTLLLCAAGLLRPDSGNVRWMHAQGTRRRLRRPRYVDLRRIDAAADERIRVPSLPILLVDSCDLLVAGGHRLAMRLITAARARGDCVIIAGRSLEACASLVPDSGIDVLLQLESGRVVSRSGPIRRVASRVAERSVSVAAG